MKIGICNDHAGYEYKTKLVALLQKKGYEMVDFGTDSTVSVDYPDFAHKLAAAVEEGLVDAGIALCGTGNGMAITLNKHQKIRAGLAWNSEIGRLVKAHNNANVLVLPARFISYQMAARIVNTWLSTSFEGGGRHERRIAQTRPDILNLLEKLDHQGVKAHFRTAVRPLGSVDRTLETLQVSHHRTHHSARKTATH